MEEIKTLKQEDLAQFCGTENWYKHWMSSVTYTDGVKHVADAAGAYWLIDAILSYRRKEEFQLWILKVDLEKSSAVLTMQEDTNEPELVRQEIEYTDFPLKEITFYLSNDVLYLPSEH